MQRTTTSIVLHDMFTKRITKIYTKKSTSIIVEKRKKTSVYVNRIHVTVIFTVWHDSDHVREMINVAFNISVKLLLLFRRFTSHISFLRALFVRNLLLIN